MGVVGALGHALAGAAQRGERRRRAAALALDLDEADRGAQREEGGSLLLGDRDRLLERADGLRVRGGATRERLALEPVQLGDEPALAGITGVRDELLEPLEIGRASCRERVCWIV